MTILSVSKLIQEAARAKGERQLSGSLQTNAELLSPESLAAFEQAHRGIFCFTLFDSRIDKHVASFIEAHASTDNDPYCLNMFVTNAPVNTPILTPLEALLAIEAGKGPKAHPAAVLLEALLPESSGAILPGLVFCSALTGNPAVAYVPLSSLSSIESVAERCRTAFAIAKAVYLRTAERNRFVDALCAQFAKTSMPYTRSGTPASSERLTKVILEIWDHRWDIVGALPL